MLELQECCLGLVDSHSETLVAGCLELVKRCGGISCSDPGRIRTYAYKG